MIPAAPYPSREPQEHQPHFPRQQWGQCPRNETPIFHVRPVRAMVCRNLLLTHGRKPPCQPLSASTRQAVTMRLSGKSILHFDRSYKHFKIKKPSYEHRNMRRSREPLIIFMMDIPVYGETVSYIKTGPTAFLFLFCHHYLQDLI